MPDLDATDLLVAAALVDVATTKAPHLRALADRLMAARPESDPELTDGPNGAQDAQRATTCAGWES